VLVPAEHCTGVHYRWPARMLHVACAVPGLETYTIDVAVLERGQCYGNCGKFYVFYEKTAVNGGLAFQLLFPTQPKNAADKPQILTLDK